MRSVFCILLVIMVGFEKIHSQVPNDDCLSSLFIEDVDGYCSGSGEFANVSSEGSIRPQPECWRQEDVEADVWFSFAPKEPGVFIQLFGEGTNSGQTINNSAISIYQGTCGTLDEITCTNVSEDRADFIERTLTDLVIGRIYYIRVGSSIATAGTFQLCIDQFKPIRSPESDCIDAVVLCDKSSYVVPNLQGVGNVTNEVDGSCVAQEFASVWYTWSAKTTGTLTFTITPNNPNGPEEDLDFAVYRLPNGLSDCVNKELLRCMASGESQGNPPALNEPCFGPTGLLDGDPDILESQGCQIGNNNFLAPLQMVEGESYALIVNNFSRSGFGFNIEFGGTGTFLGPTPNFEVTAVDEFECDKTIVFANQSLANTDEIIGYQWNFGDGAQPLFATDEGPHSVVYSSFGTKLVALTIETSRGCTSTEILEFDIGACCDDFSDLLLSTNSFDLVCHDVTEGSIEAIGSGGSSEYLYRLNGQVFQPSPIFNGLSAGDYTLSIQDRKGCEQTTSLILNQPPPLLVRVSEDDSVNLGFSLQLDSEFEPLDRIVTYEWRPPDGLACIDCPSPLAMPPGTTTYILKITDQDGCMASDEVNIFTPLVRPIEAPNILKIDEIRENGFFFISGNVAAEMIEELRIYDRWGSLLFQQDKLPMTDDPLQGWDGRIGQIFVNPGVYVWMAKIRFIDGVILPYHGDFTVIR